MFLSRFRWDEKQWDILRESEVGMIFPRSLGRRSFNVRMSHWSFMTPIERRILESDFNYDISQNNWKIIADGVATSRL